MNRRAKTWLIADHHFGHSNILKFTRSDGSPLRGHLWSTIDEHDADLIQRHNTKVHPEDKVYVLGDVAMNRRGLEKARLLNGRKILISGNHDVIKNGGYDQIFDSIHGAYTIGKYIMTHIPIHPASMSRWVGNIHGHSHSGRVYTESGEIDTRYISVSAEIVGFEPVDFNNIESMKFKT